MGLSGHRYLLLLHGFQQSGLRLGRCAVDLIRQNNGSKQRPRLKAELASFIGLHQDIGTGHIRRHQVRRELNA